MKPPAFQFYASDFFDSCAILSQDETGALIRLICQQWTRGHLPNDQQLLERLAGGKVSETVLAKFPVCEDGHRRNPRLEYERQKQAEFRLKRIKAGQASAQRRAKGEHVFNTCSDSVGGLFEHKPNSPSPSPSPIDVVSDAPEAAKPPTAQDKYYLGKELEDLYSQKKSIVLSYDAHQSWDEKDKLKFRDLKKKNPRNPHKTRTRTANLTTTMKPTKTTAPLTVSDDRAAAVLAAATPTHQRKLSGQNPPHAGCRAASRLHA